MSGAKPRRVFGSLKTLTARGAGRPFFDITKDTDF